MYVSVCPVPARRSREEAGRRTNSNQAEGQGRGPGKKGKGGEEGGKQGV